jgi:hypothetical protein
MNSKNIILHIGCGKTGSSALQNWLHRISTALFENEINYPISSLISNNPYEITSGNGVPFYHALKKGEGNNYLKKIVAKSTKNILLSSEIFQEFSEDDLKSINKISSDLGFGVKIIVYVRDVYDMVYSSYLQLVKRHSCTATFNEWAISLKYENVQQFSVLEKYERHFSDVEVIHYDSYTELGLDKPFCKAIGVELNSTLQMSKNKVNRSLTLLESTLVRLCNEKYTFITKEDSDGFSRKISDTLINRNPEASTEIYFNEDILNHLINISNSSVCLINKKYLNKTPMAIFNPIGKNIVSELPTVSEAYKELIDVLIGNFVKPSIHAKVEESLGNSKNEFRAQGRLEGFNGRVVQGWARLTDTNKSAVVELYVNDVRVGETVADKYRNDLAKKFNNNCAFEFHISEVFTLCEGDLVRARCVNDVIDVIGSPLIYNQKNNKQN